MITYVLVQEHGSGYRAQVGDVAEFDFTDFGEFNNRLRAMEGQGDIDMALVQPAGYATCDVSGCGYGMTHVIVWRSGSSGWAVQGACGAHEPEFVTHAVSNRYPHVVYPCDPEMLERPEWLTRFQLHGERADSARVLRAILLPNLIPGDILGADEGWSGR